MQACTTELYVTSICQTSNLICQSNALPKSPNIFPVIFSAYDICMCGQ